MSESLKAAITELIAQIRAKEAELDPLKFTVNTLSKQLGLPEVYTLSGDSTGASSSRSISWRLDQFTGKGLATSVCEILEARKAAGFDGPASIDEIFEALTAGGYKFFGTSGSDENTKRAIKIALTKNTAQFVKIRDDIFGLKKWYPGKTTKRSSSSKTGDSETNADIDHTDEASLDTLEDSENSETEPSANET